MVIVVIFLVGLILFDTFSKREVHPKTNKVEPMPEYSALYGVWESDNSSLVISNGGGKPFIREYSPKEKVLGTIDIYSSNGDRYKAKFTNSKEKLDIVINDKKNQLTISFSPEKTKTYKPSEEFPSEFMSTSN